MLTLHHLNNSRSQRILWLMEELGLHYDVVRHERQPDRLAPASLRAVHPLGKAPVLVEADGAKLVESGAIIEHLIERHGDGRLAPAPGAPARDRYLLWLHFAEGSLMPPRVTRLWLARAGAPAAALARVDAQLDGLLDFVEAELGDAPFLCGEAFTAADIQMSFPLEAEAASGRIGATRPRLRALLERLHARPAYRRALERGGPYDYA